MTDTKFDPFKKSALYDTHAPRWEMEIDFSEMTPDLLDSGTYLPMFSDKEHENDYDYRTRMSCPLDMCRDAIRIRRDNLWRTSPKRTVEGKYKDIIEQLIHDADGEGTTLNDFMRRAVWNMYTVGTDIVTQMTTPVADAKSTNSGGTIADTTEAGLRPYFVQFVPTQRYWWAASGAGSVLAVRYCLGSVPVTDEQQQDAEDVTQFLSLEGSEWRVWEAWKETNDAGTEVQMSKVVREGTHNLDMPPVIKFYIAESLKPGQGAVPLSLLTRPVRVAEVAMNLKSQADADLLAAVPRWLFVGLKQQLDSYGPSAIVWEENPDAKVFCVQGNVGHITEKRAWLMLYLYEILRLLKFRGSMADLEGTPSSGVKLALEHSDLDNELRQTASFCEQTELEMMRQAVILATGDDIPPEKAAELLGYTSQYERDFVLEPVAEIVKSMSSYVRDCGMVVDEVPEILREFMRQLSNALMREGSPASEQATQEIEVAKFEGIPAEESEGKTPEGTLTGTLPRVDR